MLLGTYATRFRIQLSGNMHDIQSYEYTVHVKLHVKIMTNEAMKVFYDTCSIA